MTIRNLLMSGTGTGTGIEPLFNATELTNTGSRNWRVITSSADGTKLAAVVDGGSIWSLS